MQSMLERIRHSCKTNQRHGAEQLQGRQANRIWIPKDSSSEARQNSMHIVLEKIDNNTASPTAQTGNMHKEGVHFNERYRVAP